MSFNNFDRVMVLPTESLRGDWAGLTARVREDERPSHCTDERMTWIALDRGQRRPDGASQNEFLWPTESLVLLTDAAEMVSVGFDLDAFKDSLVHQATSLIETGNGDPATITALLSCVGLEMPPTEIEVVVQGRATITVPPGAPDPGLSTRRAFVVLAQPYPDHIELRDITVEVLP